MFGHFLFAWTAALAAMLAYILFLAIPQRENQIDDAIINVASIGLILVMVSIVQIGIMIWYKFSVWMYIIIGLPLMVGTYILIFLLTVDELIFGLIIREFLKEILK